MPNVYEIRTVLDFLKVPATRRAVCLEEFDEFLRLHEGIRETCGDIEGFLAIDSYKWIDDGKRDMTWELHMKSGEVKEITLGAK